MSATDRFLYSGVSWATNAIASSAVGDPARRPYAEATIGVLILAVLSAIPVLGVVAAIVPWNGPAAGIAQKVAAALVCGCTVVLKVSPEAPTAGLILAEACEKIGLPSGVLNVLTADRAVSESLVRHPGIDMVTFTGSTAAGKRIASICG